MLVMITYIINPDLKTPQVAVEFLILKGRLIAFVYIHGLASTINSI